MAVLALNDILQVTHYAVQLNQTAYNVLHYQVVATLGASIDEAALPALAKAGVQTGYSLIMNDNASFYGTSSQRLSPLPKGAVFYSGTTLIPGVAGSNTLPKQSCGLISKKTSLAGREYRGRFYAPFPAEEDNDANGFPSPGYQGLLTGLGNYLFQDIPFVVGANGVTLRPVVWSRKLGIATRIVANSIKIGWATQRKRGTFGKPNPPPF